MQAQRKQIKSYRDPSTQTWSILDGCDSYSKTTSCTSQTVCWQFNHDSDIPHCVYFCLQYLLMNSFLPAHQSIGGDAFRNSNYIRPMSDVIKFVLSIQCSHADKADLTSFIEVIPRSNTVEPLTNDHPHQRPSLSYDHISCDGQWYLCVYESLTSDHPSYTTTPMWFWGWSYKRGSTVCTFCFTRI